MSKPELPILSFATAAEFSAWLEKHHQEHPGLWIRLYKKGLGTESINYAGALDEALCYGWIDGQKKSFDSESWIQKFTRRGPRSVWSKINTGHIERLTREGRIRPAGQAAVDAAKKDGRWQSAYDAVRDAQVPQDFLDELANHPKAAAAFETWNKTNRFAVYFRLQQAKKPETRLRRMQNIIGMLERGEKFY